MTDENTEKSETTGYQGPRALRFTDIAAPAVSTAIHKWAVAHGEDVAWELIPFVSPTGNGGVQTYIGLMMELKIDMGQRINMVHMMEPSQALDTEELTKAVPTILANLVEARSQAIARAMAAATGLSQDPMANGAGPAQGGIIIP